MAKTPSFTLWLEFEHLLPSPEDDPSDDLFNMKITLDDGTSFALNVWTFKFLERARPHRDLEAEHLAGKYLIAPDLFVEKLDRQLLEQVVADLILRKQLKDEWRWGEDDAG